MEFSEFSHVLREFDHRTDGFSESEVCDQLRKFAQADGIKIEGELLAECMAFNFVENYPDNSDEGSGWGTWFGPSVAWKAEDGTYVTSPDINAITPETLEYWKLRAKNATHPILSARYALLAWDLAKLVNGTHGDPDVARAGCDAVMRIADERLCKHVFFTVNKLDHALTVALRLSDRDRVDSIVDTIIRFEEGASGKTPGLRGIAYDCLIAKKNIKLTNDQEAQIIGNIESVLGGLADPNVTPKCDPFAVEAAAVRLARHYQRRNRPEDVQRVLELYASTVVRLAEDVTGMMASGWLQKVYGVLYQFGLKDQADQVGIVMRKRDEESVDELKAITHELTIPKEKMDAFLDEMAAGSYQEGLERFAAHFIPRKDQVTKQLNDLAKSSPLSFHLNHSIVDHEGRTVATVGPLDDDRDGHVVMLMSQNMGFSAMFLRLVIARILEDHQVTREQLVDFLCVSPVYAADKRPILETGIGHYLSEDWISAIHVLLPHLEGAIRSIVKLSGGATYKPGRNGGLLLRNVDELLRSEDLLEVFGEDVCLYLRVLLSDQRGWNARNDVCHGILATSNFAPALADRILHAMLVLSMLRENNPTTSVSDGSEVGDTVAKDRQGDIADHQM